jgi:division/cell wall cluster transcriptional repressor MraZ
MKNEIVSFTKGGAFFPKSVRNHLCETDECSFIVTIDPFERCLLCYSIEDWELLVERIQALPSYDPEASRLKRLMIGYATTISFRADGKTTFPNILREYAGLMGQALSLNQGKRYELWNPAVYFKRLSESVDTDLIEWTEEIEDLYPTDRIMRGLSDASKLIENMKLFWGKRGANMNEHPTDKLFVSYSSKDKEYVGRIISSLEEKGSELWVDYNELLPGDSLIASIQNAISKSPWFIVVLSENSIDSEWCKKELYQALNEEIDRKEVFVIPVVIDDCRIPNFIKDKVYADLRPDVYETGISLLARRFTS